MLYQERRGAVLRGEQSSVSFVVRRTTEDATTRILRSIGRMLAAFALYASPRASAVAPALRTLSLRACPRT
jgi:hypothetical protein